MKNEKVAELWVKCMLDGVFNHKPIKGNNFYGIDNYLVSYSTPICMYENFAFVCSTKKYTLTTQRHRYYMNKAIMDIKNIDPRIESRSVEELQGNIYI